ncbi:hypothetical protein GCM10010869_33100 [Mesorhizobium tianshanense]|nr:hypothetical protein GCM10010869_33100 [Mesorhizobium tianshanense]
MLAGQRPAIKQVDDGIWLISFILVDPEGVASAMAPTMLHVGNAVGMALLIAIANRHVGGLSDDTLKIAVADGIQVAYWLAAAGETKMKSGRRAGQISAMSLSLPG